jgi:hypothetical protein
MPAASLSTGSFRLGWQLLLASLGTGFAGPNEAQNGTGETPAVAETLVPKETGNTSANGAGRAATPQETPQKGQGSAAVATISVPAGSRSRILAAKATPDLEQPAFAEPTDGKGAAKDRATEFVSGVHTARSEKGAADKTTAVSDLTSQSMPVLENPVAPSRPSANLKTQVSETEGSPVPAPGGAWQGKIAPQVATLTERGSASQGPLHGGHEAAAVSASVGTGFPQQSSSPGESSEASEPSAEPAGTSGELKAASVGEALRQAAPARGASENDLATGSAESSQTRNEAAASGDGPSAFAEAAAAVRPESSREPFAPSTSKKPGSGLVVERSLSRPVRELGTVGLVTHQSFSAVGQTGLTAQDGAGLVRDPGSWHGTASGALAGQSGIAAPSKEASAIRETFAALDAEPVTPTWVHASQHRAEAGFQDPALGWVGVRADSSGGSVHAALVPGSADAAQTLAGHLAGLNAYLADHHTPVDAVTMAPSEDRSASYGMGQNMNQEAGQGGTPGRQSTPETPATAFTAAVSPTLTARTELPGIASNPGGAHISVMA